jgi:single-stranded-DNA-specific exonuclease
MKFRWSPAPPQPLLAGQLVSQLKISPLLARCLLNRGFSEPAAIENFLSPRLKNLADPFLLPNMATPSNACSAPARKKSRLLSLATTMWTA